MENIKKRICKVCHKKLNVSSGIICRCKNLYCSKHRYAWEHDCLFDIHSIITRDNICNQKIGDKIIKI
jgi:hypothetical protein